MTRKLLPRLLLGLVALVATALLAYTVAGPYLAMNGLRNVVADGQYDQLWRFVDFERLRESVRPQVQQRIVRGILGRTGQSQTAEAVGGVTALIAQPAIDAMVSPTGIALLLRGSALAGGARTGDASAPAADAHDPLRGARTRFESPSLFTATVENGHGEPVVFEFRRSGLAWKLAGLRLPSGA